MSSPEREMVSRGSRWLVAAGLALAVVALPACTARPLYSTDTVSSTTGATTSAELAEIAIKPVQTRYAQEVRNHLIFLFGKGAGQSTTGRYSLELGITELAESAVVVQVADENEPTAGTMTLISNYVLTDTQTGDVVSSGKRQISASYDRPRQEFAALRARRDAEDRAARELAEVLNLTIASAFASR